MSAGIPGFVVVTPARRGVDGPCPRGGPVAIAEGVEWHTAGAASTPEALAEVQPLAGTRAHLVYVGRVDNRQAIGDALGRPELGRAADGAVLLAAFEAWGHRLTATVVGEFAFAAIDGRTGELVAGQDALGVRRVYYRRLGDRVCLASDLRLLFGYWPEARPEIDGDVLPEYFTGPMTPWSGGTVWRGVRELSRGHVLRGRGRDLREEIVWTPAPVPSPAAAADVDAEFRRLLFAGVRASLRTPGAVLCDLSGGVDSSSICAVAGRLRADGSTPPLIGWSLFDPGGTDGPVQQAVAAHCGLPRHALDVTQHLPFAAFRDSELPGSGVVQCGAVDRAVRAVAASHGATARLSGQGADILLQKGQAAPRYLAEWLRAGRLAEWRRDVAAFARRGGVSLWHLLGDCTLGTLDMHAGRIRAPLPDWLRPRFREAMRAAHHDFLHPRHRWFTSDAREYLLRATLAAIPRHGEILPDERLPLLYRPLVEFVLGLDWRHLVRPGAERRLVRRSLRAVLPAAIWTTRADTRYSAHLVAGLRAAWPRVSTRLSGRCLADLGVVEARGFRTAIETLRGGYSGPNLQCTHTALYLEAWLNLREASPAAQCGDPQA